MSETTQTNPATPPAPLIHRDIFTLEKGHLVVQWPDELTPAEYADIVEWTAIWLRKMKRNADRNAAATAAPPAPAGGNSTGSSPVARAAPAAR